MLPGLAPRHTRPSFGSGSRLYIEKIVSSSDDFLRDEETGLWLLPKDVAERDRGAGEQKLAAIAVMQTAEGMHRHASQNRQASKLLGRTLISEVGCMVGGVDIKDRRSPSEWAYFLAEQEQGSAVLDEVHDLEYLRACSCEDCYNPRHFELQFGRNRSHDLNPNWFVSGEEGSVETIWGDKLPTISESLRYFIEFKEHFFPYVPIEKSVLTAGAVAQIGFHPLTGCWEAWNYYRRPNGITTGRFDGYGNFYVRFRPGSIDEETGEILSERRRGTWLAHRITWVLAGNELEKGKVLNHRCNYKRCCNPLHLEQVSESYNVRHGIFANDAIRRLDQVKRNERLGASELAKLQAEVRNMYHDIFAARI